MTYHEDAEIEATNAAQDAFWADKDAADEQASDEQDHQEENPEYWDLYFAPEMDAVSQGFYDDDPNPYHGDYYEDDGI